jgi:hypothetical protein
MVAIAEALRARLAFLLPFAERGKATPGGKKSLWKNPLLWSTLCSRLQQHSATPRHTPTVDALHAGTDSLGSALAEFEPLKDSRALVIEWPKVCRRIFQADSLANDRFTLELT